MRNNLTLKGEGNKITPYCFEEIGFTGEQMSAARLYDELAWTWEILVSEEEYIPEAKFVKKMIDKNKLGVNVKVNEFNYSLPDNKIAKYPLKERNHSKLLVYKNQKITEDKFYNVISHIASDTLLIFSSSLF